MATSRSLVFDDSSPTIVYDSSSFSVIEPLAQGRHGPPLLGTLHRISAGGSLSFNFTGTNVTVYGATLNPKSEAPGPSIAKSVQCFIDDQLQNATEPTTIWELCGGAGLDDNFHTLKLSSNESIYVDFLEVVSTDDSIPAADVMTRIGPDAFNCTSRWSSSSSGISTTSTGESCILDFEGESLAWAGFQTAANSSSQALAFYSIDDHPPHSYGSPTPNQFVQDVQPLLFKTHLLRSGSHTLTVSYNPANVNDNVPLTLSSVLVAGADNNTQAGATPSPQAVGAPSSTPPAACPSAQEDIVKHADSKMSTEALGIIGGCAGLVLILLVGLTVCALRMRRTRLRKQALVDVGPSDAIGSAAEVQANIEKASLESIQPGTSIETVSASNLQEKVPALDMRSLIDSLNNTSQKDVPANSPRSSLSYTTSSEYPTSPSSAFKLRITRKSSGEQDSGRKVTVNMGSATLRSAELRDLASNTLLQPPPSSSDVLPSESVRGPYGLPANPRTPPASAPSSRRNTTKSLPGPRQPQSPPVPGWI